MKNIAKAKDEEDKRRKDQHFDKALARHGINSLIGELLRRQREFLDLSQKDIGDKLNYRYFNFISMIEGGACKIPANRIFDLTEAYKLDPELALTFIRILHPEIWDMMKAAKESTKIFNSGIDIDEAEANLDKKFKAKLKEFRLPNSA